jgi:GNAT superfamily N-acetyltransferase
MNLELRIKGDIEPEMVKEILAFAPWAQDRSIEQIKAMLEGSDFALLLLLKDRPVGFARVITDYVFRSFIEDVVVHPDYRGTGIGRMLVETLECHIKARGVERIELTTGKAEFWRHMGFAAKDGHMIKNRM